LPSGGVLLDPQAGCPAANLVGDASGCLDLRWNSRRRNRREDKKSMPSIEDSDTQEPDAGPPLDPQVAAAHWRKTSNLMWIMLTIWFVAGFLVHVFAPSLNTIVFMGFPLGFYMAAQGSLIIFVVSLFWFAHAQNKIDEEFGVQED
jgi:putative solute:sodium symporter small subunit